MTFTRLKRNLVGPGSVWYDRRPFVGEGGRAFLAYSQGLYVLNADGTTQTSALPGQIPGSPIECLQYDKPNNQFLTFASDPRFGSTAPFTLRTYAWGPPATLLDETVVGGEFGDTTGDMLRLEDGSLVACWRGNSTGYSFRYRTPAGIWQAPVYLTNIQMKSSLMKLVQHPDGSIWCFITRDGLWPMPVIHFSVVNQNLAVDWQDETLLQQQGELSPMSIFSDKANNRIIVGRAVPPFHFFYNNPDTDTYRIGASFGFAFIKDRTSVVESPPYPGTTYPLENMQEAISPSSSCLSSDGLYTLRQQWNQASNSFDSVCLLPYTSDWGQSTPFYHTPPSDNQRGGAKNFLTTFYGDTVRFLNSDETGQLCVFTPLTVTLLPPANFTVVQSAPAQVKISFTDTSTNEDRVIIESAVKAKGQFGPFSPVLTLPANTTQALYSVPQKNQQYQFRARAAYESDFGLYSAVVSLKVK